LIPGEISKAAFYLDNNYRRAIPTKYDIANHTGWPSIDIDSNLALKRRRPIDTLEPSDLRVFGGSPLTFVIFNGLHLMK